ncbi:hypothetical protein TKK_0015230 [Trichogramma kaykai]|uniref:BTB domain-containing protein n=1 Tax=Trichogramma kaykai TaxID=54128 RepID=A0ABD2WBD9_9HYME
MAESTTKRYKSVTKISRQKCEYLWKIEDFPSLFMDDRELVESARFGMTDDDCQQFQLRLGFCDSKGEQTWISLYLCRDCRDEQCPQKLKCQFAFSFVGVNTDYFWEQVAYDRLAARQIQCGYPRFVPISSINQILMPDRSVTVRCEIILSSGRAEHATVSLPPVVPETNDDHDDCNGAERFERRMDFGSLLLNERFSDVKIKSKSGERVAAHKAVLSGASQALAGLFARCVEGCVDMDDLEHECLVELLRYVYTGETRLDGTELDEPLLVAADRYGLEGLKARCEDSLAARLTLENFARFLHVAQQNNASRLKKSVLRFVVDNRSEIMTTPVYRDQLDPLMLDLIEVCVENNQPPPLPSLPLPPPPLVEY